MPEVLIVTRHKPLVVWLAAHGITGPVIEQAGTDDVYGKDIYGILPLHLAANANSVTEVSMPFLTLEQRKKNAAGDLTVEEMDAAGAHLRRFVVREDAV
jgi:putative CRISPR-associated protein (TIGR02620 family)